MSVHQGRCAQPLLLYRVGGLDVASQRQAAEALSSDHIGRFEQT